MPAKNENMLTHAQIWTAIDALAAKHRMSASGLARKAQLDPTTFNKSKRLTPDGRQRWPSTESVAKILIATGASLDEFVALISEAPGRAGVRLPAISSRDAARDGSFTVDGAINGDDWNEIPIDGVTDPNAFVLELDTGDAQAPYREGDMLIVAPGVPIQRGNRLFLKLTNNRAALGILKRETASGLDLVPLAGDGEPASYANRDILWRGRILWASQ